MSAMTEKITQDIERDGADGEPGGGGGVSAEVAAYVGLVRTALRDLPPEDVEDLTGGLEADLSELAAETEEPLIARLGEPSAYAAELRSAAGFPPPGPPPAEPRQSWWRRMSSGSSARWLRWRAEHPWLEQARPVWWVLRGAVLAYVLFAFLGAQPRLLILVLGAVLSFWAGLHQDQWDGWRAGMRKAANVAAAVMLLPVLAALVGGRGSAPDYVEVVSQEGVSVEGERPASFFVYDADGQRVDGARIFTDQGTALTVSPWDSYDGTGPEPAQSQVDTFPVVTGSLDGWNGWGPDGWTPPVAIPPAFPIDPADEATTDPSTGEPTESVTAEVPEEPTSPPTPEPTTEPTGTAAP